MHSFLKPKLAKIFISPDINAIPTIIYNLYQNFIHVALKTAAYLRGLKKDGLAVIRPTILLDAIYDCIGFVEGVMDKSLGSCVNVKQLGCSAFLQVFETKPSWFDAQVLAELRKASSLIDAQLASYCSAAGLELIRNILL